MLTITLNDDTEKCFNLNNNEREKALYNAWYSMSDNKKFADKKLKIITHANEKLELKISEIKDCKHEDCIYCDNPEVRHVDEKKEEKKEPKTAYDYMEEKRKKRHDKFFEELNQHIPGVTVKPDDPFLLQVLASVDKDFYETKIPYYANLYADYHRKVYFR